MTRGGWGNVAGATGVALLAFWAAFWAGALLYPTPAPTRTDAMPPYVHTWTEPERGAVCYATPNARVVCYRMPEVPSCSP